MVDRLFATPLYFGSLRPSEEELVFLDTLELVRNDSDNLSFSQNRNIFDFQELRNLKSEVDKHVKQFCLSDLGLSPYLDFQCNGSWLNNFHPGDWAGSHYHANCFVSGVLYLNTPEASGDILFHNDIYRSNVFGSFFSPEFVQFTEFNVRSVSYSPSFGDIYLFPSSLPHSVEVNNSSEVRKSIAFDYMICGRINSITNSLLISK